jgi:hypothetical protein
LWYPPWGMKLHPGASEVQYCCLPVILHQGRCPPAHDFHNKVPAWLLLVRNLNHQSSLPATAHNSCWLCSASQFRGFGSHQIPAENNSPRGLPKHQLSPSSALTTIVTYQNGPLQLSQQCPYGTSHEFNLKPLALIWGWYGKWHERCSCMSWTCSKESCPFPWSALHLSTWTSPLRVQSSHAGFALNERVHFCFYTNESSFTIMVPFLPKLQKPRAKISSASQWLSFT